MNGKYVGACRICGKKEVAKTLCYRHYKSERKYGSPTYVDDPAHKAAIRAANTARLPRIKYWEGKKRGPHSDATRAKMSLAKIGRPKSAAHRANIAKARTGVPRSSDTVEKMRVAARGRRMSEKNKALLSERWKGRGNPVFGKNPTARPRGGWVTYNGIKMRSKYEARFAAAMDARGIEWQYEPRRFDLGECTYLPDFLLPRKGIFVETKGWMDDRSKRRIRLFREQNQSMPLLVLTGPLLKVIERSAPTLFT